MAWYLGANAYDIAGDRRRESEEGSLAQLHAAGLFGPEMILARNSTDEFSGFGESDSFGDSLSHGFFPIFLTTIAMNPCGKRFGGASRSNSMGIICKNSLNFRRATLLCAFSRPRRRMSTFTLSPRSRNFFACAARISRSWVPVANPMRIPLTSDSFCFLPCSRSPFSRSYLNLPNSMMRATGGLAVGAISMRSRPRSPAALSASESEITPRLFPSSSMTRRGDALIN